MGDYASVLTRSTCDVTKPTWIKRAVIQYKRQRRSEVWPQENST